jgi:hypothetical protein
MISSSLFNSFSLCPLLSVSPQLKLAQRKSDLRPHLLLDSQLGIAIDFEKKMSKLRDCSLFLQAILTIESSIESQFKAWCVPSDLDFDEIQSLFPIQTQGPVLRCAKLSLLLLASRFVAWNVLMMFFPLEFSFN